MLLVAGGIFMHNFYQLHKYLHYLPNLLAKILIGLIIGTIVLGIQNFIQYIKKQIAD